MMTLPRLSTVFCIVLATLGLAEAACAQGSGVVLSRLVFVEMASQSNVEYTFRVAASDLLKTPEWEPGDGKAPLTRDRALELARESLTAEERQGIAIDHPVIQLERPKPYDDRVGPIPKGACRWFYMVFFPEPRVNEAPYRIQTASRDALRFLVTMNGEVVRPEVEERK